MSNSTKPTEPSESPAVELQLFVTETLKQLCEGIKGAMKKGVKVSGGTAREVEFDVAVTATGSAGRKAGAGIFVGGFGIGGQATSQETSSTVSRIKFAVPVFFPGNE